MLPKLTNTISVLKHLVLVIVAVTLAINAHASLGLGKKRSSIGGKKLLTAKVLGFNGNFSLKSGYNFRGNAVLDTKSPQIIQLNTEVTAKKGNFTFTIPLRKQVLVSSIKIGVGNGALRTH